MLSFLLEGGLAQHVGSTADGTIVKIFGFQRDNRQEKQAQKLLSFLEDPATGVVAMKTILRFRCAVLFGFGMTPGDEYHGIKLERFQRSGIIFL